MTSLILNTRLWLLLCASALGVMVLLSLIVHVIGVEDTSAAGRVMLPVYFGLFLVLGFSALPLMTNLFVAGLERMWAGTGLLEQPLNASAIALLHRHHVHFVLVVWAMFVAGLVLAAPHMLRAWGEASPPSASRAPAGAMPPLEHQVRHAKQILLLRTDMQGGKVRYGVLGLLKQEKAIVATRAPGLLEINTAGFELLGYQPAHDRPVVMFFSEPDSTGKTLFEILLPAADGTMTYPAYAAPPDPAIARKLTLEELQKMIAERR